MKRFTINSFLTLILGITFCFNGEAQIRLLPDSQKTRLYSFQDKKKRTDYLIKHCWKIINQEPGKAIIYAKTMVELGDSLHDSLMLANGFLSKGTIYQLIGDYPKSIFEMQQSVLIYQKMNDTSRLAIAYNNLGNTYRANKDYDNALTYQHKALDLRIKHGDSMHIRGSYINLCTIFFSKSEFRKAKSYMNLAMKWPAKSEGEDVLSKMNMAAILTELNEIDSAKIWLNRAKDIAGEEPYYNAEINFLYGGLLGREKKFNEAEKYFLDALNNALASENTKKEEEIETALCNLYKQMGKPDKALKHYERSIALRDSMFNSEKALQVAFLNTEFEVNQKEKQIELLEQQKELNEIERKRNLWIIYIILIGLIIIGTLAISIYKRSMDRKKLSDQLLQKNKEITDSITYARRLQEAILPPISLFQKNLVDYFVLYKPKDIVAGDFYFFEQTGSHIIVAAADCTGHGVPGAMVSVVCSNALVRSVREFGITDAARILDKTRELMIETLSRNMEGIQDGMDISLLSINKSTNQATWAGAINPLILIRNKEIIEFKGDKQPIGISEASYTFASHPFSIEKGDKFYLFTDGFADQFGGEKGKKFKYKQLKELLLKNHAAPMNEQEVTLNQTFDHWRKGFEQIDDVCVIGIGF